MSDQVAAAKATGFSDFFHVNVLMVVEIGNGSSHPKQLKSAAGGEAAMVDQLLPQLQG